MARESAAVALAIHLLGNADHAKTYLNTPNFALGGNTPMDLLQIPEGAQLVLNELQTHLDGGPV